jgi:N-acylneuraminate cytidylyltransferase
MSIIAIIPARGGSRRIPRKNIRPFFGRPIIAYPLETAQKSGLFDEIMVSTEDEEIASAAREYGASVPFLRSAKNASDLATTSEVIAEVVLAYESAGMAFDHICCLYPTAALIDEADLTAAHSILLEHRASSVLPVIRYSHPPQRGFLLGATGRLERPYPKYASARTQDLEPIFHDAGQFYFVETEQFLQEEALITKDALPFLINEFHAQDIDTLDDWRMAEIKYQYRGLLELR